MKKMISIVILTAVFASSAMAARKCTEWLGGTSGIYIKICEYEGGGSGYYKFRNDNNRDARVSFKLIFNDGKALKGSTPVKANSETGGASCFSCAERNSGVARWIFRKIYFRGDKGF